MRDSFTQVLSHEAVRRDMKCERGVESRRREWEIKSGAAPLLMKIKGIQSSRKRGNERTAAAAAADALVPEQHQAREAER